MYPKSCSLFFLEMSKAVDKLSSRLFHFNEISLPCNEWYFATKTKNDPFLAKTVVIFWQFFYFQFHAMLDLLKLWRFERFSVSLVLHTQQKECVARQGALIFKSFQIVSWTVQSQIMKEKNYCHKQSIFYKSIYKKVLWKRVLLPLAE